MLSQVPSDSHWVNQHANDIHEYQDRIFESLIDCFVIVFIEERTLRSILIVWRIIDAETTNVTWKILLTQVMDM